MPEMAGSLPGVVVLGDINCDVFMDIPVYPAPGGDALAYELRMFTGGSVINSAILLRRLGIPVRLISRTGTDAWADLALADLQREGIGLQQVSRDSQAGTGLIFISVTPDGERTMFSYRGANARLEPDHLQPRAFEGMALLHLTGYSLVKSPQKEAAIRAVEIMKAGGGLVSLDLGVEPARLGEALNDLLPQLDLLVLGPTEAGLLTGAASQETAWRGLLERGVKLVGLKLGKDGCLLAGEAGQVRLDGLQVDVVDTTGAGDAFSAGLIYSRLHGLGLGPSAMLANAFGALAATVWGGGIALPPFSGLLAFLRRQRRGQQPWDSWLEEALESLVEDPEETVHRKTPGDPPR
jgi:ribokinase